MYKYIIFTFDSCWILLSSSSGEESDEGKDINNEIEMASKLNGKQNPQELYDNLLGELTILMLHITYT